MVEQEENRDLSYPIVIADDARPAVRDAISAYGGRFVVLCDAHPEVTRLARSIGRGPDCLGVLPFALGERRKRFSTLERVHEALVAAGADRTTLAIGVGGGVASDLFGFAAATYMRGIRYAHVATTLVAMADAAVGGKTGVDLAAGKNLAGVFADPVGVYAHVDALQTLPYRHVREGLAEVVKAAVIEGDAFWESLEVLSPHAFWRWPWLEIVSQAVRVKTMIVSDDRLERGTRELLNLGHTFGHALELASGYRITHGAGVAIGLRAAGILAQRLGMFDADEHVRILAMLALLGMPMRTTVGAEAALEAMRSDKKRRDGVLRFVLPRSIGDVEYGVQASDAHVLATLREIGRTPEVR